MDEPAVIPNVTRVEVEEFLFKEADMLDRWDLTGWLTLFEDTARYEIPATDLAPQADSNTSLFLVADDMRTLRGRVERLEHRNAYVESPRSRTRRFISNVRVTARRGDQIEIQANFQVFRFKNSVTDSFIGQYHHTLRTGGDELKFIGRKVLLDLEALRPVGKISILL